MLLSRSSLPVLLVTISLSTLAWLFRFSTEVRTVARLRKHASISDPTRSAHTTNTEASPEQMQYLNKLGELFSPETPPIRSEKAVHTKHVIQQEGPGVKEPGVTRFVTLSDTHGLHVSSHSSSQRLQVPEGDVLVFAGDAGIARDGHVQPFRSFLKVQPHGKKVVTFGNMDHWVESPKYSPGAFPEADAVLLGDAGSARASIEVMQRGPEGQAQPRTFQVAGSPYTPKYYGSFQLQDEQHAEKHWRTVLPPEQRVDVLVTHGPPFGTGDYTRGRHVGDKQLLEAVQNLKTPPLLWVVGHIHNGYGAYTLKHEMSGRESVVANVATNDLRSGKDTPPMVFDVRDPSIDL